ncbi:hypothetical protein [Phytohabitans houttuyneae]|uniref:Uncharacterized protein n=2 Tax=Phytohabitans houttuyneae TaxID=1076126 RepID=A0A6V8K6U0_9ACTN|nr:hypothetical protein [Phytohabitans houttuyneae]GFJ80913.1 hypothetical protein Phou_050930 [Phytohabitans houttuyneae]
MVADRGERHRTGLYLPSVGVYVAAFSVPSLETWIALVAHTLWTSAAASGRSAANGPMARKPASTRSGPGNHPGKIGHTLIG